MSEAKRRTKRGKNMNEEERQMRKHPLNSIYDRLENPNKKHENNKSAHQNSI